MTAHDILLPGDSRTSSADLSAVRLGRTKTGKNQYAILERPELREIATIIAKLSPISDSGDLIFPSRRVLARALKYALSLCKLDKFGFSWHSLRHGGATDLLARKVSIETILERGRWASTKSAKRYLQSGLSLQISIELPTTVNELCDEALNSPESWIYDTLLICDKALGACTLQSLWD